MTSQSKDAPLRSTPAGQDQNQLLKPKHIPNPRRLLIVSPSSHSQTTIPPLLHSLTGTPVSTPPQTEINIPDTTTSPVKTADDTETRSSFTTSFAGYTTHAPLRIQTKYYTTDVPIWVDEIPLTPPPHSSASSSINDDGEQSSSLGNQPQSLSANTSTTIPTTEQWKTEFLSSEAHVVRDAIGAVVICVQNPSAPSSSIPREAYPSASSSSSSSATATTPVSGRADVRALKDLVRMIADVKSQTEEERGEMGEVPGLLVLIGDKPSRKQRSNQEQEDAEDEVKDEELFGAAWWEDELYDMGVFGFEVVLWDPKADKNDEEKRNQFGEYEGMRRIKEVLETHDWAASISKNNDLDDILHSEDEHDYGGDGFKLEVDELEREMMGLRFAIQNGGGGDDHDDDNDNNEQNAEVKVEELEALMMRMRAIKDMSADLPESQRKAFASKAIRDIMREL